MVVQPCRSKTRAKRLLPSTARLSTRAPKEPTRSLSRPQRNHSRRAPAARRRWCHRTCTTPAPQL